MYAPSALRHPLLDGLFSLTVAAWARSKSKFFSAFASSAHVACTPSPQQPRETLLSAERNASPLRTSASRCVVLILLQGILRQTLFFFIDF